MLRRSTRKRTASVRTGVSRTPVTSQGTSVARTCFRVSRPAQISEPRTLNVSTATSTVTFSPHLGQLQSNTYSSTENNIVRIPDMSLSGQFEQSTTSGGLAAGTSSTTGIQYNTTQAAGIQYTAPQATGIQYTAVTAPLQAAGIQHTAPPQATGIQYTASPAAFSVTHTGTVSSAVNDNLFIPDKVMSVTENLGINVSHSVKEKIVKGEFIDLAVLLQNSINTNHGKQKLIWEQGELMLQLVSQQ